MARKQEPGKLVSTTVPGIYKRTTQKGATSWVVRIYNPDTKRRDDYTAVTWQQAKDIKADAERAKRLRRRVGRAQMTVAEWAVRWPELFPRRKESTNIHNAERVAQYVRDFGPRLLPGCTTLEAHEWAGQNPGRVRVVKAFLNDALRAKLIEENPFDGIDKGAKEGRRGITVLTDHELNLLVATAGRVHGEFGEQVLGPMIDVMAGTGARPGEVYAMDRDCIDFDEGEVHIWRQFNGKTRKLATLKGTRLDRTVVMHDRAIRALERMELPETGSIWRTVRGVRFKQREQTYYWPAIRTAFVAQLPESHHLARRARGEIPGGPFDPYELRHFFGTELARAGASLLEIMDQMGHEDAKTTRVYLHMTNEDVRTRLKRLRRAA